MKKVNNFFYSVVLSKKNYLIFLLLILMAFQGCTLHPKYQRPCVELPEHWRVSFDEASSYANCRWWEELNDPVLNDLIIEALESNYDLKVAIARVNEFSGNLLVARSPLYPQVSAEMDYLRRKNPRSVSIIPYYNIYSDALNISYEVDVWGKIQSASEAALAQLLASIEARRTVVLTVVTSVAMTYITLRQYDKQLEISEQTLESRKHSYEIALDRFLGGVVSELDARQAEAQMESALAAIVEFNILIEQEENLLSILVGHPPESIKRGLALSDFRTPVEIPAGIPSEVLEQRPDILGAEQALIAANATIGVAIANFFPDISLTGLYGNQSLQLHTLLTGRNTMWQYAAAGLQPLFTGWQLTGQLEQAEAQKMEAYYQYFQVVLNAFREVNDALILYEESRKLVEILAKRVEILEKVLALATLQYDNGEVDYLNVLNAQTDLFDAQLSLSDARGRVLGGFIDIYKSLGGGWVIDADQKAIGINQEITECDQDINCN